MTRNTMTLTVALAAMLVLPALAAAETITITTADGTYGADAEAQWWQGVRPHGDLPTMKMNVNDYKPHIRFDLSALPENAVITDASFTLDFGDSSSGLIHSVRTLDDGTTGDKTPAEGGWDESASLWDSYPTMNPDRIGEARGVSGLQTFTNFTGTGGEDLLVEFLNNDTNGLVTLVVYGGTNSKAVAATKENTDGLQFPTLEIQYIPEPATMGLLGIGAVGLLRRKRK